MAPHANPTYALERVDDAIRILVTYPGDAVARVAEACLVLVDLDDGDFPGEAGELFGKLEAEFHAWPAPATPPDADTALRIAGKILDLRVAQQRLVPGARAAITTPPPEPP